MTDSNQINQSPNPQEHKSRKKKLTWLLILQAWAMLWVVIGHTSLPEPATGAAIDGFWANLAEMSWLFAYSFHMPLFIMISGYLFNMTRVEKGWKYSDMVAEKWWRLGIPYIFFIAVATILKIAMPGAVKRQVEVSVGSIAMGFVDPSTGALGEMWFIAVIFIYFLLYPVYPYLLRTKVAVLVTLTVAALLHLFPIPGAPTLFSIDMALRYFVFFFGGMVISRYRLDKYIMKWGVIAVSLAAFAVSMWLRIPLLLSCAGSIAFWGLAIRVDKALSNNIFSSFRNYTYQIFLIGIFVQMAVKVLYTKFQFPGSYAVWWVVSVLGGVYISVLIARIAEKSNSRVLKMLVGL